MNSKDTINQGSNLTPAVITGVSKAQVATTKKVETVRQDPSLMEIIQRIDISTQDTNARELQKKAFAAISNSLRRGESGGTIKLPTGTGKTYVFAMLLRAFQKNGLILVPRVDLYSSTARDLQTVGFNMDRDIHFLHEQDGSNTEDRMMALLTDPSIDWSSGKNQCIMTYQALTAMIRKNPDMGTFMRTHFDIIIEDEAHRGLGDKTRSATDELTEQDGYTEEDNQSELGYEHEAEKLLKCIKYNYKFTATPDLIDKSVVEDGEYIYYATVEDAVRTGAIILPQYVDMGSAYTKNAELNGWKVSDIELLSEGDNFVDESGKSIRDKIIDAYIEKRDSLGSLPGVAFASTIKHAEQIVQEFEKKGIRAARVTSGSGDISSGEATLTMDRGQLDIIVTVTKVSEGFDYPDLACAMWFCPSLSSAKVLQGNGRIMRITEDKKPDTILDEDGRVNLSPTSYIIAPSVWYGGSSRSGGDDPVGGEPVEPIESPIDGAGGGGTGSLPRIGNFYELLIERGEFDINAFGGILRNVVNLESSLRCEPGEEKEIDGVIYVGVITRDNILGVNGFTILNNLKRVEGVRSIIGRQRNGFKITLVPRNFIEELRVEHICEPGEEKEIDGVIYVGVTTLSNVMGVNGYTILDNLKRVEGVKSIGGKQPTGKSITLIPKDYIQNLLDTCEPGEEKEIDGVIYVGVTEATEVMGVKGGTILRNFKKTEGVEGIIGRQRNGNKITLVPKSFIEKLIDTCEPGEEKEIDGVVYVGVTYNSKVLGVNGFTILNNLKGAEGVTTITGRNKNGYSVNLVPKSFIVGLRVDYTCEPGEEKEIDGVIYVGVTHKSKVLGVNGSVILNNLKKAEGVTTITGRNKNGYSVNLVPKSFIVGLRVDYTCEPGEEKEIDGVIYVGVINTNVVMGIKGETLLKNIKKDMQVSCLEGRQKSGLKVTLVPRSYIQNLLDTCEPGEEKEIDGVIYVGVTTLSEVMGIKGPTIFYQLKQNKGVNCLPGRQRNGYSVRLVPKSFIELLNTTCEPGEEKEIDGVIHVGVSGASEVMKMKGKTILKNLKNTKGVKSINEKQKNGQNVTLVPKSFIEGLKK